MSQKKLPLPQGYVVVKEPVRGYAVYGDYTCPEFPSAAVSLNHDQFLFRITAYRPTRYDALTTFALMRAGMVRTVERIQEEESGA